MDLSIIIPAYNAEPYIFELLDRLAPQITEAVEVIVIDDGSTKTLDLAGYPWAKVIYQRNQGASAARNKGLSIAKGEYIAFIDADDLVSDKYIETILNKAKTEKFDYCYLSWKSFGGWPADVKLTSIDDHFPEFNLCVWNRIYKRSMIGKVRFNTKKAVAEDAQFIREVKEEGKKKAFIGDYMYFYRSNADNSLTDRAGAGKVPIKRIIYYYDHVTPDMTFLIDEFKELDKDSEVILMTNNNEIPELEDHAVIIPPRPIKGTERRGQETNLFYQIPQPIRTQVCIFIAAAHAIGGIETWTYNFCKQMHKYYDILVLYHEGLMHPDQFNRLAPYAQIMNNDPNKTIICDTAINCRVVLPLPKNVEYKKKIQLVHTCRLKEQWEPAESADEVIYVSKTAAESFDSPESKVIHNLTAPEEPKKLLILVSACRLTYEKGGERMLTLARMLEKKGIPYVWYVFTDAPIQGAPHNMIFKAPTLNIGPYVKAADWLIQLSSQEAFCYSIVEAWEMGTRTITTALPVLGELGFEEGKQGYTLPWNVEECENIENILYSEYKPFEYRIDNEKIIKQWRKTLGNTKPTKKRTAKKGFKLCMALRDFDDMHEKRRVRKGEIYQVPENRAVDGQRQGFFKILEV